MQTLTEFANCCQTISASAGVKTGVPATALSRRQVSHGRYIYEPMGLFQ